MPNSERTVRLAISGLSEPSVAIFPINFQIARREAVAFLELPEAGRQRKQLRSLCGRQKLATPIRPRVQEAILPSNASSAYNFLQTEEFVATIIGIIAKPLPMGAIALFGIAATAFTGTLTINQALSGFGNSTIWLIVVPFFISHGFIKTGLGSRIAYLFMAALGKRTLGLSYGLIATDLVLAPAIPSDRSPLRGGGTFDQLCSSYLSADRTENRKLKTEKPAPLLRGFAA